MRFALSSGAASGGALAVIGGGTTLATSDATLLGWAAIIVGASIWVWSLRIDGRPWWKRRKPSIRMRGRLMQANYHPGTIAEGIKFEAGMSHVTLWIANVAGQRLDDLQIFIKPEKPILKAVCRAQMADCSIGLAEDVSLPFVVIGKDAVIPPARHEDDIILGPAYRLYCPSFPAGDKIQVDLATVTPLFDVMSARMWEEKADHPRGVSIYGKVRVGEVMEQFTRTITFERGTGNG